MDLEAGKMTRFTVTDSLLTALGAANDEAELFDSAGQRLGYFLSDVAYRKLVCRWANRQVTDAELDRCRQEAGSYSTTEILDQLNRI
jgi:hypothetical protein